MTHKKIHKNSQNSISENDFIGKNIFTPFREVLFRFPLAIGLFAILTTIWSIYFFKDFSYWTSSILEKITLAISISAILSIAFRFLYEKFENKNLHFLQILAVIYGIFIYFSYYSSYAFFSITALQLLAFFASIFWIFHVESKNDEFFYNNFLKIISALLIAFLLGITSGILGWIAIGGIFSLFELNYDFFRYARIWWTISLAFIAPVYALAHFPKQNEISKNFFEKYIIWEFFTKFLFVPFVSIYFIILYAYSVKVLMNFSNWPRGEVTWLVIGFSLLGYLTYILTKSIENSFIKKFRKILPFLVFPQIFMLFYAIYLRIAQYGLTTNRYIVVLAGISLLVISLYYMISKKKSLKYIPLAFSLVAFVFSFGPWGIHYLPQKLQFESLKKLLIETEMYQNGQFQPFNEEKFSEQRKELIYGKIKYLCSGHENICYTNEVTEFFKPILTEKTESGWQISKILNVNNYSDYYYHEERKYKNFYSKHKEYIIVKDFDYYIPSIEIGKYSRNETRNILDANIIFTSNKKTLSISDNDEIFEYDFKNILENLKDQNPDLHFEMIDTLETKNYIFQFNFNNISFEKTDIPTIEHAVFDIYIKKK